MAAGLVSVVAPPPKEKGEAAADGLSLFTAAPKVKAGVAAAAGFPAPKAGVVEAIAPKAGVAEVAAAAPKAGAALFAAPNAGVDAAAPNTGVGFCAAELPNNPEAG